jgi:hypothetical protein
MALPQYQDVPLRSQTEAAKSTTKLRNKPAAEVEPTNSEVIHSSLTSLLTQCRLRVEVEVKTTTHHPFCNIRCSTKLNKNPTSAKVFKATQTNLQWITVSVQPCIPASIIRQPQTKSKADHSHQSTQVWTKVVTIIWTITLQLQTTITYLNRATIL